MIRFNPVLPSKSHWPIRHGSRVACVSVALACMGAGLCPSTGLAQPTDPLNTLLYTPEQRQAIERSRLGARDAAGGTVAAASKSSSSTTTRLDGVVARERGKGTAWINGEPVAQGASPSTVIVGTEAVVEGHRLRVGESFDNSTGAKSGVVAPGEVSQRRPP